MRVPIRGRKYGDPQYRPTPPSCFARFAKSDTQVVSRALDDLAPYWIGVLAERLASVYRRWQIPGWMMDRSSLSDRLGRTRTLTIHHRVSRSP